MGSWFGRESHICVDFVSAEVELLLGVEEDFSFERVGVAEGVQVKGAVSNTPENIFAFC